MPSQVLTIMFSDIKGFTARTSQTSRSDLRALLQVHEELLLPIVRRFGGTLIKTIGDALLVTFTSPTNAVLCGLMMQERLREYNAERQEREWIEIRVAINTGEVELRGGDAFGEPVNIASRIEGITEAGEIYFTESVYLAMNKAEVPTSEVGLRVLKGIPDEIKVYRVIQDRDSEDFRRLVRRIRETAYVDAPEEAAERATAVVPAAGS